MYQTIGKQKTEIHKQQEKKTDRNFTDNRKSDRNLNDYRKTDRNLTGNRKSEEMSSPDNRKNYQAIRNQRTEIYMIIETQKQKLT